MTGTPAKTAPISSNVNMKMSTEARARMRVTEKLVLKYYNDMGKKQRELHLGARLFGP